MLNKWTTGTLFRGKKKWTGIDNNEPDLILHNDLLKYKAYTEE